MDGVVPVPVVVPVVDGVVPVVVDGVVPVVVPVPVVVDGVSLRQTGLGTPCDVKWYPPGQVPSEYGEVLSGVGVPVPVVLDGISRTHIGGEYPVSKRYPATQFPVLFPFISGIGYRLSTQVPTLDS